MRVLVCGSRDGFVRTYLERHLDDVRKIWGMDVLINGGCRGVDQQSSQWARSRGVAVETFPAEWDRYGKFAGPRRNQKMVDIGRPDMVVAFPGGAGTADMVCRAKSAKILVLQINDKNQGILA